MIPSPPTFEPITQQLAGVLAEVSYAKLPPDVVSAAERAVLDWLGSACAGSLEPPARMVQHIVATLGTSTEATMFGAGRSSALGAALANGVASHILELDDVHKGSTLHAAAAVIPAAFAVSEREHTDGRGFLLAVALGYEAALRIGEAVNPSHYRFWHPTGTVATFGAAVAAGAVLKLNATQMLHALGSAGTQAAGLWEFNADGAMSKHLHPGKAALNGVLAADLALLDFTAASRILEGERGFFRAMSESYDASRVTAALGEKWKILENCYKLHSCCGHTHTAIDIALDLRAERNWSAADVLDNITAIHIQTYGPGFEIVKELNPRTPYQAKFSIGYCVAVALLDGRVGLEQFSSDRFGSEGVSDFSIAHLLQHTDVSVADDLTAKYPAAWPARISFTLHDGTVVNKSGDYPRGNPENPVSKAQLEEKFQSLVASRFGLETAAAAREAVHNLQTCKDVAGAFPNFTRPVDTHERHQSAL